MRSSDHLPTKASRTETFYAAGLKTASAFFHHEAAGGIVLLIAAIAALLVKNTAWGGAYDAALEFKVGPKLVGLNKPLLLWINDALMAVFFLLVGLEIKRELVAGELSSLGSRHDAGHRSGGWDVGAGADLYRHQLQ